MDSPSGYVRTQVEFGLWREEVLLETQANAPNSYSFE